MSEQKFSLMRFSVKEGSAEIPLSLSVAEKLDCTLKSASNIVLLARFADNLQGSARLTPGYYEHFTAEESLQASASGDIAVNLGRVVMEDALQSIVNLAADVQVGRAMEESLECNAYLSNNMQIGMAASDVLESMVEMAADIPISVLLSETLNCDVSGTNLNREVVQLNVTIPPGGRLIIDTDLYTVTLNDENVIDLHSGDWPWLARNLVELDVDSGTGGALTGKVIYTERYL